MSVEYPNLQDLVIRIVEKWLNNPFFIKYNLFPFRWIDNHLTLFFNRIMSRFNRYCNHRPPTRLGQALTLLRIKISKFYYTYFFSGLYVQLMKSNTTFIFTLIELYRRTKKVKYKIAIIK